MTASASASTRPTAAARRLGPRVLIAALKDARGTPPDFQFTPLGAGDIDFQAMTQALADGGFDGYLVVEHESHVFGDTRDAAAVLAGGHAFAEKLARGTLSRSETRFRAVSWVCCGSSGVAGTIAGCCCRSPTGC